MTDANRELVRDTFPWLYSELADRRPCFAAVRSGYAGIVSAAWAAATQEAGRVPLDGTGWGNITSLSVARHLGLIMVGADATWM